MERTYDLFVYGTGSLLCSIGELEDDVFDAIEGFGDITGSGIGAMGWNLDIAFESPNAFTAIIGIVGKILTAHGVDLSLVEVSVRGKSHRLVELL